MSRISPPGIQHLLLPTTRRKDPPPSPMTTVRSNDRRYYSWNISISIYHIIPTPHNFIYNYWVVDTIHVDLGMSLVVGTDLPPPFHRRRYGPMLVRLNFIYPMVLSDNRSMGKLGYGSGIRRGPPSNNVCPK